MQITDSTTLEPLFTTVLEHVASPVGDAEASLQLQVNSLDWDDHKGKIVIGRIFRGVVKRGQKVAILHADGTKESATVTYLFNHVGLVRVEVDQVSVGDIVAVAGIANPKIGDTIADAQNPEALPHLSISEPTVKIQLSVNTSPLAGRDAQFSTSRQLRDRLTRELETNVGLRMEEQGSGERVTLIGRGELHLAILIETMRRESYEFSLSRPEVVLKTIDGQVHEPWESVTIDVPSQHTGTITAAMAQRRALLVNMQSTKHGVRFAYEIATANLIGYRNELISSTSGEGVLNSVFLAFKPRVEDVIFARGGAIIAHESGPATAYSIEKAQQRGELFVAPGEEVYSGQVVGINSRAEDMVMSVTKGKKLTNMRASSADATVTLAPPKRLSLEQYLTIIGKDEMLEVTPNALRLRKKDLKAAARH